MLSRFFSIALCATVLSMTPVESWARGGGGGGGRGGSRGGGGGFSGGASRGGGGFSGGSRPSPSPSFGGGSRPSPSPSFGGGSRPSPSPSFGGGSRPSLSPSFGAGGGTRPGAGLGAGGAAGLGGGPRPGAGIGSAGSAGAGGGSRLGAGVSGGAGSAAAAGRFSAPSQGQLGSFLGLPSDEGLGHAASAASSRGSLSNASTLPARDSNFDVNYGTKEGPRGGQAAGVAVTGPQGNTAGKAAAVGPQGGVATVGGVKGADGGVAARGAAVGPNGQVVAGRGAIGPGGYGGGSVVTAGPAGVGAGFTRVTPSGRYTAAAAVRGNYNNWGVYNRGWYANYPGAWFAAGWAANALWTPATWGTTAAYCGYVETPPVYYDYGNNVVYEDSVVYVNGESAGTTEEYYDQAMAIATEGTESEAAPDGDWMPLGVFAFTKADNPKSDITIQLAVNKEGVIRGNYTDTATKQNQVIQGSIDKETQRAAFTVGDNKTSVIETGIYNLTKDEAPCLVHIGKEQTEQWLLVRLTNPEAAAG